MPKYKSTTNNGTRYSQDKQPDIKHLPIKMYDQNAGGLSPEQIFQKYREFLVKKLSHDKTYPDWNMAKQLNELPENFIRASQIGKKSYLEWLSHPISLTVSNGMKI